MNEIPYARQIIDEDDIRAVVEVLRSDMLTTGPKIEEFEGALAEYVGAKHAAAVSSGTAALHAAMFTLGIGPGDEVIVPAITFAATANCVVFMGGRPVFADVDEDTLLIDPGDVERKITARTRAIIAVDYAGQPCDYEALRGIAERRGLALVADGCHALGARYRGRPVGSLADMTVFSFHPVKHITTGEGGMVVTDREDWARRLRMFRTHGITRDPADFSPLTSDLRPPTSGLRPPSSEPSWFYEMVQLGYNYRLTDIQCALGISQLRKLPGWLQRRRELAAAYDDAFAGDERIRPLAVREDVEHAYHLYVVRLGRELDRGEVFRELRRRGIGVNVHYIPVHLHPFYRRRYGTEPGECPVSEDAYEHIISLPMFPSLTRDEVSYVVDIVHDVARDIGGSH